jgi:hypothetical protein
MMSCYMMLWRNKFLTVDAKTMGEMAHKLREAAAELEAMHATGKVTLEGGMEDDYALLVTTDLEVAKRFGFWEEDDED